VIGLGLFVVARILADGAAPAEPDGRWQRPFGGDGWGYPLSTTFGAPEPGGKRHTGLDLVAPCGTPVWSIGAGEVVAAVHHDAHDPTGKRVVVRHTLPSGRVVFSQYAHLMAIDAPLGPIAAGAPIGRVGADGPGRACHLHLAMRRDAPPDGGRHADPTGAGYLDPDRLVVQRR